MQQYGGGSGGGGSTGNGPPVDVGIDDPFSGFTFTPSRYLFTDPPRYFKANDPYYYEVDNIPLKQIQENCLWLRDQMVGLELSLTGVPLSKILDLQPSVSNADRIIRVNPGKFSARVNDAFGLSPLFSQINNGPVVDITRPTIYEPPDITVTDAAFSTIVAATVENLFYSNGLYDQLQTHGSQMLGDYATAGGQITFNYDPYWLDEPPLTFSDLPKIKTAVWQQISHQPSLQQLAVDFTRRWHGVFRTAVVNVSEPLSVEIPPFNISDFIDNDANLHDPQVRIDLVFIYTHPIDAAQTYLAQDADGAPEVISVPRLGVVKGAGQILTPQNQALNITGGTGIGSPSWLQQSTNTSKYYSTSAALEPSQDLAIQAPLADQVGDGITNPPFPGKTTGLSFPSPDDLLNLAPLIVQGAMESDLVTIGQSVLPICYVIVKKDSTVLLDTDIIDIRPFLRTAELAYNERAGIGAANPPLSMGNPATGKAELYQSLETTRDYMKDLMADLSAEVDARLAEVPIAFPRCCLQYYNNSYFVSTNLQIASQKVVHDGYDLIGSGYEGINAGKVFEPFAEGSKAIKLIPGRYLIEGSVNGVSPSFNDGGDSQWEVTLRDGNEAVRFPDNTTFNMKFYAYRSGSGEDRNTEKDGTSSFSTILILDDTDPDGAAIGTDFVVHVARASGSQNTLKARAGITITRVANVDGSPGTIRSGNL